jgi:hypothetical protein
MIEHRIEHTNNGKKPCKTWSWAAPAAAVGLATTLLFIVCVLPSRAQSLGTDTVPSWAGKLLMENSTITADPTLTAPEAQGLGLKFELLFAMMNNQDPLNTDNDVISVLTAPAIPGGIGVAVRDMLPGAKVQTLTDQINLKYYFPDTADARTCSGGSPRIQLFIDPGDGTPAHNAFGYVGHGLFGTGCLVQTWDFVDMSNTLDPVGRWDLSQFLASGHAAAACDMTCTWAQVVTFFGTLPNHVVLSGGLYDDSCSFDAAACGQAYYDLLTVENRTLSNREDTVQGPTQ